MNKNVTIKTLVIISDFLIICIAHILSWWLRFEYNIFSIPYPEFIPLKLYLQLFPLAGIIWIVFLAMFGSYRDFARRNLLDSFFIILKSATISTLLVAALSFILRKFYYSRLAMCYSWFLSIVFILFFQFLFGSIQYLYRKSGLLARNAVLIGEKESVSMLEERLRGSPWIRIVNTIIDPGDKEEILEKITSVNAQEVITLFPLEKWKKISKVIDECVPAGVKVKVVSDFFQSSGKVSVDLFHGIPVLEFSHGLLTQWNRFLKRVSDICISIIIIPLLIPIVGIISLAIIIDSRGPVLFRQERTGKGGKKFLLLKFRSMFIGSQNLRENLQPYSQTDGPIFKIFQDPRLTYIGKFLRKFYLDEIPQFWNVIKGEMTLVGPRPLPVYESEKLNQNEKRRTIVPPGITGLWQVTSTAKFSSEEMFKLDRYYIENWSLLLDFKILFKTLYFVFSGKGI